MTVLARSELEASPLADLHTIANQVGLEGFRRLRKAELIDAILGETVSGAPVPARAAAGPPRAPRPPRAGTARTQASPGARTTRPRRGRRRGL
jgi:transcription termination factor Rho